MFYFESVTQFLINVECNVLFSKCYKISSMSPIYKLRKILTTKPVLCTPTTKMSQSRFCLFGWFYGTSTSSETRFQNEA
jgi:hypothetical protein